MKAAKHYIQAISAGGLPSVPGRRVLSGIPQSKDRPSREPGEGVAAPPKRRAAFYFDGFNLYHALKNLIDPHLRWLNLRDLANTIINHSEAEVVRIVWCSAEYRKDPDKIMRHRAYVKALRAVGCTPILGHFVKEFPKCAAHCKQIYEKETEKAGDVNVAIYLIADGLQDKYDDCYLVSADSDQIGTVDMCQQVPLLRKKRLTVVAPPGTQHSKHLLDRDVLKKTITRDAVERSLFEKTVLFPDGSLAVERPSRYDPPRGWRRPQKAPAQVQEVVFEETIVTKSRVTTTEVEVVRKKKKKLIIPPGS